MLEEDAALEEEEEDIDDEEEIEENGDVSEAGYQILQEEDTDNVLEVVDEEGKLI
jgi:hypothetical protein